MQLEMLSAKCQPFCLSLNVFKEMQLEMLSAKCQPFCLSLNVLICPKCLKYRSLSWVHAQLQIFPVDFVVLHVSGVLYLRSVCFRGKLCFLPCQLISDLGPLFTNMVYFSAWISIYIHYKAWDKITYAFPNFNSAAIEVWVWIGNFIPHFMMNVISHSCWD